MFFGPSEYSKSCKVGSRCQLKSTVEYIEHGLDDELEWFRNHSQFRHLFHMPKEANHKLQGMWMLLLRTASTMKERECWFVVNGVPIRYSLREHALLTGLDCHDYPKNYKALGNLEFAERMFGKDPKVSIEDVEEKLGELKKKTAGVTKKKSPAVRKTLTDRLKLTILYFLCKVVKAKSKVNANIDSWLLSIVDDVHACETFPWGRFTFEETMKEIRRFVKSFKGVVKPKQQSAFGGFVLPLEILAYEAIPNLGRKFREAVPAEQDCPRCCKHKFSDSLMKGHPLDDINEAVGRSKDISSILEPDSEEKALLERIIDDDFDDGLDTFDPIIESWRERLTVQKKNIFWRSLFDLDISSRSDAVPEIARIDAGPDRVSEVPGHVPGQFGEALERKLKKWMEKGFEKITQKVTDMEKGMDARLKELEKFVSTHQESRAYETSFEPSYEPFGGGLATPYAGGVQPSRGGVLPSTDMVLFTGVPFPSPPIIVDITEEETGEADDGEKAKKTKLGNKEKKAKEKNDKEKKKAEVKIDGGLIIASGKKRSRNPTMKFTPTDKKKQPTGKKKQPMDKKKQKMG